MMLPLGELLCYAAFAVVLDRKYKQPRTAEYSNQDLWRRRRCNPHVLLRTATGLVYLL